MVDETSSFKFDEDHVHSDYTFRPRSATESGLFFVGYQPKFCQIEPTGLSIKTSNLTQPACVLGKNVRFDGLHLVLVCDRYTVVSPPSDSSENDKDNSDPTAAATTRTKAKVPSASMKTVWNFPNIVIKGSELQLPCLSFLALCGIAIDGTMMRVARGPRV